MTTKPQTPEQWAAYRLAVIARGEAAYAEMDADGNVVTKVIETTPGRMKIAARPPSRVCRPRGSWLASKCTPIPIRCASRIASTGGREIPAAFKTRSTW